MAATARGGPWVGQAAAIRSICHPSWRLQAPRSPPPQNRQYLLFTS